MIRVSKWSGLVTAASPYILPAGGSVEQINAMSHIPGQLTVRGGMQAVLVDGPEDPGEPDPGAGFIEIWGYSAGISGGEKIFAFTDDGQLVVYDNPQVA